MRNVLDATGIAYWRVLEVLRGPALAAALMVLVVILAEYGLARITTSLIVLITGILVGAFAYVGFLRWLDPESFRLARGRFGRFVGLRQVA